MYLKTQVRRHQYSSAVSDDPLDDRFQELDQNPTSPAETVLKPTPEVLFAVLLFPFW